MMNNNGVLDAVVKIGFVIVIILVVMACMLGFYFSGSNLFQPEKAQAEAETIQIENEHLQNVYTRQDRLAESKIELEIQQNENRKVRAEADLQAYLNNLERQRILDDVVVQENIKHQQMMNSIKQELSSILGLALISILLLAAILVLGLLVRVIWQGISKLMISNKNRQDADYWKAQRQAARQREYLQNLTILYSEQIRKVTLQPEAKHSVQPTPTNGRSQPDLRTMKPEIAGSINDNDSKPPIAG